MEFIVGGLVLLVPLFYLVIAVASVQAQTMGVEAIARHTSRVLAADPHLSDAELERIVTGLADQYGLDSAGVSIELACSGEHQRCPEAGSLLTVQVTGTATLPMVPALFDLNQSASIPVSARVVQKVSDAATGQP